MARPLGHSFFSLSALLTKFRFGACGFYQIALLCGNKDWSAATRRRFITGFARSNTKAAAGRRTPKDRN
jgi:hypothetical protein